MAKCEIFTRLVISEEALKNAKEKGIYINGDSVRAGIPNTRYYFSLGLNGSATTKTGVWAFCDLVFGENRSVQASITFSVKSANSNVNMEHLYEKDQGWGRLICSYEDLMNPEKKYIVDGRLIIDMTGTLELRGIKRKAVKPAPFFDKLLKRNDKDFCVTVGKEKLKVHKFILGARSPVFQKMIESGLEESKNNSVDIVDFSYEAVKIAMDFCYDQEIADQISLENASDLLHFAAKYDMEEFHTLIENTLTEKITASNVCQLANMSHSSNSNLLLEHCICFLLDAIKTSLPLENIEDLNLEVYAKICQRSFTRASVVQ